MQTQAPVVVFVAFVPAVVLPCLPPLGPGLVGHFLFMRKAM